MHSINTYLPVQHLRRSAPKAGGLCWALFFLWDDVLSWPAISPATGGTAGPVQLRAGAVFYTLEATEKDRFFKEELKHGPAGPYLAITVNGRLAGNSINNTLSLGSMQFHQFGLIIRDRNGEQRLIGGPDAGARLVYDYHSGSIDSSRGRQISWNFEHPTAAPFYLSGSIMIDNDLIPIGPVAAPSSSGSSGLTPLAAFAVGTGQPMDDGADSYTHAALSGKKVRVYIDGIKLIETAVAGRRHMVKNPADNFFTVFGGVYADEFVEIYTYE